MSNEISFMHSVEDVNNALFELGILDEIDQVINENSTLRDELGCDSQEITTLCEIISTLALSKASLDENKTETVKDLLNHLVDNRDPWLPSDISYVLQGSVVIDQDINTVFGYIRDHKKWPEVIKHVTKIEPIIDDSKLQSFKMHIEELDTKESYFVESWRYVNEEQYIVDFLQPIPPEGFLMHKGGWRFQSLSSNQTRLISYHGFELDKNISIEASIVLIRKHIDAALATWARYGNA